MLRRTCVLITLLSISFHLYSQNQKKSAPADQKAFSAARKISDPQQKIDALRNFVTQYPKSTRVDYANDLIFETLVKSFPDRTTEIQRQIGVALKHAKGDYNEYDNLAGTLADHDVLLGRAQELSEKSLKMLKEPQFTKAMKRGYAAAKARIPDAAAIHHDFLKTQASLETTLGHIYIEFTSKSARLRRVNRCLETPMQSIRTTRWPRRF